MTWKEWLPDMFAGHQLLTLLSYLQAGLEWRVVSENMEIAYQLGWNETDGCRTIEVMDLIASTDAVARTTLIYPSPSVLTHETLAKGFVLQMSLAQGLSSVARVGVPFGGQSWELCPLEYSGTVPNPIRVKTSLASVGIGSNPMRSKIPTRGFICGENDTRRSGSRRETHRVAIAYLGTHTKELKMEREAYLETTKKSVYMSVEIQQQAGV
ncbi:hypothetical protein WISP_36667 [Willisornis vidua]|uniref:Uncharacterized protein n=1 Tax=Willisornis vidua TaxID=1566151 RepID=A0ABQ9DPK9_9PASS|nr:hypothetical protein WISP_36667 [Willisornis vidua]